MGNHDIWAEEEAKERQEAWEKFNAMGGKERQNRVQAIHSRLISLSAGLYTVAELNTLNKLKSKSSHGILPIRDYWNEDDCHRLETMWEEICVRRGVNPNWMPVDGKEAGLWAIDHPGQWCTARHDPNNDHRFVLCMYSADKYWIWDYYNNTAVEILDSLNLAPSINTQWMTRCPSLPNDPAQIMETL